MSRALVTGASGAVAHALIERLLGEKYRVHAFSRTPSTWEGVETHTGDLLDESALDRATRGVEVVFHLAALLHINQPGPELHAEYERVNVRGTEAVLRAAERNGVTRVVFFSTVAVYGPTGGGTFDERSPASPETPYAKTKLAAESLVLDSGVGTVLRLAAVYGPYVKGNYRSLARAIARGRFLPIGRGMNRRTLVYEDDVAEAALLAARHPGAPGQIFNVTDGMLHTVAEIIAAISEANGRRAPRIAIPAAPARLLARMAGRGAMIDKYMEDVAVDGTKAQTILGFTPRYDLRAGWREAVRRWQ